MSFIDIFQSRNRKLVWYRIPDNHVVRGNSGALIVPEEDYIVVRMIEMWLVHARKLWRQRYPMLHAFLHYGPSEDHAIVGPAQLRDLGERNIERIHTFRQRLFGPTPHKGFELHLLVGLYAVAGKDMAKALVDVVGSIASLAGPTGATSSAMTSLLKSSVDKIVGLPETVLQIGVGNSWPASETLTSGYYVAIDADVTEVPFDRLWLDAEHRLVLGADPRTGTLYKSHDYMVLSLERQTHRQDWSTIPSVSHAEDALDTIISSPLPDAEKCARLNLAWPAFESALETAEQLSKRDAKRIALAVKGRIIEALYTQRSKPFQVRGAASEASSLSVFEAAESRLGTLAFQDLTLQEIDALLAGLQFEAATG